VTPRQCPPRETGSSDRTERAHPLSRELQEVARDSQTTDPARSRVELNREDMSHRRACMGWDVGQHQLTKLSVALASSVDMSLGT
jgi:hypothetical protein